MSSAAVPRPAAPGPWARIQDLILPIGMIASVLVIMVPVPAELMDLLLAANITIAVIMLLTTLYVRTPLEFNIFPSLLLATTLFRLVLNVATTRLILTRAGSDGLLAAGGVVRTFGQFVTGGAAGADNIVVGLIIFSIIVVIQFVVITKGATRISEVAARFTLDGMPGRADGHRRRPERRHDRRARGPASPAGDHPAGRLLRRDGRRQQVRPRRRHRRHHHHSDQYRRRTVYRHRPERDEPRPTPASLFTTLTIGDGLVTQVPAFLISLAAGMLVTRSSQESNLPKEFLRQLFSRPQALAVAGGFLALLIFTSLPRIPLFLIGAGCVGMAVTLSRRENKAQAVAAVKKQAEAAKSAQRVEDYLTIEPMELELGIGLIRVADPQARRRLAGSHPARAAEPGRRDGRHSAQGPRARQHAASAEPIPDQDRRRGRRPGNDRRKRGRAGQRDRHAPERNRPATCRRTADSRRREAPDRPTARRPRRPWSTS